ncbi:MAG TPA: choice-of-anchor Q domain-containing protein, partial [Solirubrobacteraceae bacterium]|nr:choice-of-anchor Q domain-containing protein [Solirubrobacteraceae bacterium]
MTRVVLAAVCALLALPGVASADVVVDATADGPSDGSCTDGDCTLREAVATAPAGETVIVPAGDYALVSDLVVPRDMTIQGAGARSTTIRRDIEFPGRVLSIDSLAAANVSGVLITGGTVPAAAGGGILVEAGAELHLSDSAVEGNDADRGGGIVSSGTLVVERSTLAFNGADGGQSDGRGGGLYVAAGTASLENSTISSNSAEVDGGGIYTQANLDLTNVTIADNFGGGLDQEFAGAQRTLATSVLLARNLGGNCGGTTIVIESTNGLSDDGACEFDGSENQVVPDSRLDFLADNGGETDTHALLFDSPAVDAGATPCVATDQRGIDRPQGDACDIGAVEVVPPATLTVNTVVSGGGWDAEDFTIRVTRDGGDAIAPRPGNGEPEGDSFAIPAGTYRLGAEAARGYVATPGPGCEGDIVLAAGEIKTCTLTFAFTTPPDNGLVIESYSPARTDFDWGLTESFLDQTRGYLQDGALFGATGIVPRRYDVAPGIRVANARTLAGADVFFTGWVETSTFSAAEKEALRQFVLDGGTLIATTDDTGHTMVDAFGLEQADGAGNPTENVITA